MLFFEAIFENEQFSQQIIDEQMMNYLFKSNLYKGYSLFRAVRLLTWKCTARKMYYPIPGIVQQASSRAAFSGLVVVYYPMHASFSLLCLSVYPSSYVTTVAEEFNGNGGLKLAFNQNSFCYRGISFLTLLPPCLFTTLHDQGCVIPCKICATIIFHFSQHMPSFTQRN